MKYRQRGYKDDEANERQPRKRPGGPRDKTDRPRGRGVGAPTETVFRCARCGELQRLGEVALDAVCGKCGQDLHTCTNCAHFDTSKVNECTEPVEQPVMKKSKRNDCPLFAPKETKEADGGKVTNPADPRAAFDALFKL